MNYCLLRNAHRHSMSYYSYAKYVTKRGRHVKVLFIRNQFLLVLRWVKNENIFIQIITC